MRVTAEAHPNIALVKYWGKAAGGDNVPATPSLSITLDTLVTTTTVGLAPELDGDRVELNGAAVDDAKILGCIARLRRLAGDAPPVHVTSRNNFPTAAGLASSAAGFAALVTALDAVFELGLDASERSQHAREASASAARSLFGGFAALDGANATTEAWRARPVLDAADWPLAVVIAICDESAKAVSSTDGMNVSRSTSPYFDAWVSSARDDFVAALAAIDGRDFSRLARVSEWSCLKMHGLMLSSDPGLVYWQAPTLDCIHRLRALSDDGVDVFFTIDAGPQVKAVCMPNARARVEAALAGVPGVHRVIGTGLGPGAHLLR